MRLTSTLIVAALFAATPALAQDALKVSDIGPNADRDFWCANAFSLTAYIAGQAGDQALASADNENMQTIFTSIVTTMKAANLQQPQFEALNKQYSVRLMDPYRSADSGYDEATCAAAAVEAKAVVAAAMAEAAAAEAAAGAAKPADAAPADAPAMDAPAAEKPAQ